MKVLPSPGLSLGLLVAWLVLNNTLDPGQVLLGGVLALGLPFALARLWPGDPGPRHPGALLRLAGVVLLDILVANLQVARRILGPESVLKPAFVEVPLDIRNAWGITALAGIITMTPGTVSVDVSPDRNRLLVHALDVPDQSALVRTIKARYEAPLRQIFGEPQP